jgi:hypothetical protein
MTVSAESCGGLENRGNERRRAGQNWWRKTERRMAPLEEDVCWEVCGKSTLKCLVSSASSTKIFDGTKSPRAEVTSRD